MLLRSSKLEGTTTKCTPSINNVARSSLGSNKKKQILQKRKGNQEQEQQVQLLLLVTNLVHQHQQIRLLTKKRKERLQRKYPNLKKNYQKKRLW